MNNQTGLKCKLCSKNLLQTDAVWVISKGKWIHKTDSVLKAENWAYDNLTGTAVVVNIYSCLGCGYESEMSRRILEV